MNSYQKFNTWGRLRSVMLGTYFTPEFFGTITDARIREPLMQMAHDINEDLETFHRVLKDFGCDVIRPVMQTQSFDVENVYQPTLQVRNTHCVVGKTMYQLNQDFHHPVDPVLRDYCNNVVDLFDHNEKFYDASMTAAKQNYNSTKDLWYSNSKYTELAGADWPKYEDFVQGRRTKKPAINTEIASFRRVLEYETKEMAALQGPNVINLPDRILVDANEYCNYAVWLKEHIDDHRPVYQFTTKAGHVDGCFVVIGPNTILGIDPLIDYNYYFPGFEVIKVSEESYQHYIDEFNQMKSKVDGRWWLPGEEQNNPLINFVEVYLKDWTGYVAESVFDVNVLVLDQHTVCVSNITPEIAQSFKQRGIEYVVVPWRHRFFVDGGLHCITLDLYRD